MERYGIYSLLSYRNRCYLPEGPVANSTLLNTGFPSLVPVRTNFVTCVFVKTSKFGLLRAGFKYAVAELTRLAFSLNVHCVQPDQFQRRSVPGGDVQFPRHQQPLTNTDRISRIHIHVIWELIA